MKIINETDVKAAEIASQYLRQGKIISFATDTVYGLAADATNKEAVDKLYYAKRRNLSKPIAIFLPNIESAKKIFLFSETAEKIAHNFFKKSLTLVLPTKDQAFETLSSSLNQNSDKSLGFRIVYDNFVEKLLAEFNGILAVTSANKSDCDAAKTAAEVQNYFSNDELDLIVKRDAALNNKASTVIKVMDNNFEILRQGNIFEQEILEIL